MRVNQGGLAVRLFWTATALVGCLGDPVTTAPQPKDALDPDHHDPVEVGPPVNPGTGPETAIEPVAFAVPTELKTTPSPLTLSPGAQAARDKLAAMVQDQAFDPDNPWAVVHGFLVTGPDVALRNGEPAVPYIFDHYGRIERVEGSDLLGFPKKVGNKIVEPHSELILKSLVEGGLGPEAIVEVGDQKFALERLWRGALSRADVQKDNLSYPSWNDTPWALQAIATWAPKGFRWKARGHDNSVDQFVDLAAAQLAAENLFLAEAQRDGKAVQKRGQGIFAYTCGGAHLWQGVAYASARGFGSEESRAIVKAEGERWFWRLDFELALLDGLVKDHPEYELVLLGQRLKFDGHFLETTHKGAILGLIDVTPAHQAAWTRAADDLGATVARLEALGVLADPRSLEKGERGRQQYLDLVGDGGHAVKGLDLATGAQGLRY